MVEHSVDASPIAAVAGVDGTSLTVAECLLIANTSLS